MNENKDALDYLEKARDLSFVVSSREIGAYCYSSLARGYATFGDEKRFTRAINTAITLADDMRGLPIVTKDYVFHAYSAVLEEKSNGLILLGSGKEALNELHEIDIQITQENNTSMKMWIPLDYAQSFMLIGEIEASIQWLETFLANIRNHKSARLYSKVEDQLEQLGELGYSNVPSVKNFTEMYYSIDHSSATE